MKPTKIPDGMFPRYGMKVTPENRDSPEVKQYRRELAEESRRQQDPYYLLGQYRAAVDETLAKLKLKHDKPALREAIGMPEGGEVISMEDGSHAEQRDAEHVVRRVGDLKTVTHYAAKVEAAIKARKWKAAIVNAVWLGISAHKALIARPLEPEVLRDRGSQAGRAKGRPKAAIARAAKRKKLADQDRPPYQERMLKLRLDGIGYELASNIMQGEFRKKKKDRHYASRIRELAPDPMKKKNPTPPKDYVR